MKVQAVKYLGNCDGLQVVAAPLMVAGANNYSLYIGDTTPAINNALYGSDMRYLALNILSVNLSGFLDLSRNNLVKTAQSALCIASSVGNLRK